MKNRIALTLTICIIAIFAGFNISQSFNGDSASLKDLLSISKSAIAFGEVTGPLKSNSAGTLFECGCTDSNSCAAVCE